MSQRYVISLSGERGKGPWMGREGFVAVGTSVPVESLREAEKQSREAAEGLASLWRVSGRPNAKVFRLVRKPKTSTPDPKRRALRDAVVEAACAWVDSFESGKAPRISVSARDMFQSVRALRAHERGE